MNIGRLLEDNILRFGQYEFVNHAGQWHTNTDINRVASRLGHALKQLGVAKGDRVGVQLLNSPQLIQSFFAVFKIGAILVPVNPSLRVHDLAYLYKDAGMKALISSSDYLDGIREARRDAPEFRHLILTGESIPDDALSYDKLTAQGPDDMATADTDNDDTAVLIYTGGTTGNPKGVMLSHYSLYTHVTGYYETVLLDAWGVTAQGPIHEHDIGQRRTETEGEVFGIRRRRVSLIALPLFHGYGVFAVNLEFLTGGKLVLIGRWNAEEAMACVGRYRITEFRGVPTMYIQMLNHPEAGKYDMTSMQTCICGFGPHAARGGPGMESEIRPRYLGGVRPERGDYRQFGEHRRAQVTQVRLHRQMLPEMQFDQNFRF